MELLNTDVRNTKLAFIGAGNMATAIITGLLEAGFKPNNILACAPSSSTRETKQQQFAINTSQNNLDAIEFADVIVIAVKPNLVEGVAKELDSAIKLQTTNKIIISVAAGIKISQLQACLSRNAKVIAAMPNLPCAVKQGVIGLVAAEQCEVAEIKLTEALFSTIGRAVWLDNESQMAALVASAGSSPAYFFLFLEAMIESAKTMGLSEQQAKNSVLQSGLGALTMALNSDLDVTELRRQVTSPNGTTHQAIESFLSNDISAVVDQAMQAAAQKAANY